MDILQSRTCCSSRLLCWLNISSQLAQHAKGFNMLCKTKEGCLTTCLVFKLYTVTLVVPLLVTATRVPEAFQLAYCEAECVPPKC